MLNLSRHRKDYGSRLSPVSDDAIKRDVTKLTSIHGDSATKS